MALAQAKMEIEFGNDLHYMYHSLRQLSDSEAKELIRHHLSLNSPISTFSSMDKKDFAYFMQQDEDLFREIIVRADYNVCEILRFMDLPQPTLLAWTESNPFVIGVIQKKSVPLILKLMDQDWRIFLKLSNGFTLNPVVYSKALAKAAKDDRELEFIPRDIFFWSLENFLGDKKDPRQNNVSVLLVHMLVVFEFLEVIVYHNATIFEPVSMGYKLLVLASTRSSSFLKKISHHGNIFSSRLLQLIFEFAQIDFFVANRELSKDWVVQFLEKAKFFFPKKL